MSIFPCGSRRSKRVPSSSAVFLRLLVGEIGSPQTCPNLCLWQMGIPIQNTTTRSRRVRYGPTMSENAHFWSRMYFSTKYLCPCPQYRQKPHFGGPFNAKPTIERALRKPDVNGATKLKLYSCIFIGNYSGCVKIFPLGGVRGAQTPQRL